MVSTAGIILLLIAVVFVGSLLGVGAEAGKDIKKDIQDAQDSLKDQPDSSLADTGNFAKDIGAEVCNLNMKWFGSITANAPFDPESLFTDQEFLWMGDLSDVPAFVAVPIGDTRIREYTWFCELDNPLSFFSWQATNSFSLFDPDEASGDTIRIKWIARSLDNNKFMFDRNGNGDNNNPFQQETRIRAGTILPANWVIDDRFEAVTHDDYIINYWSDEFQINTEDPGHRFNITLCRTGISSC